MSCNNRLEENFTSLNISGDKNILKDLEIKLISNFQEKIDVRRRDTVLVFKDSLLSSRINLKALSYKYQIIYKDSFYNSYSFDNVVKAIGKEKAKHHWHFIKQENNIYTNFNNHLIDDVNDSSYLLKKNKINE